MKQLATLFGGWLALWAMGGIAQASGIITDPRMSILQDEFSDAFTNTTMFQPDANGGGVFGFYNPTGVRITELTLTANIATGLDPTTIAMAFACNDPGSAGGFSNPFFLHCGFS